MPLTIPVVSHVTRHEVLNAPRFAARRELSGLLEECEA